MHRGGVWTVDHRCSSIAGQDHCCRLELWKTTSMWCLSKNQMIIVGMEAWCCTVVTFPASCCVATTQAPPSPWMDPGQTQDPWCRRRVMPAMEGIAMARGEFTGHSRAVGIQAQPARWTVRVVAVPALPDSPIHQGMVGPTVSGRTCAAVHGLVRGGAAVVSSHADDERMEDRSPVDGQGGSASGLPWRRSRRGHRTWSRHSWHWPRPSGARCVSEPRDDREPGIQPGAGGRDGAPGAHPAAA